MRRIAPFFVFFLLATVLLTACNRSTAASIETQEIDPAAVFTQAVMTARAQVSTPTPTALPATQFPTNTPTPTVVPTLAATQAENRPAVILPPTTPKSVSVYFSSGESGGLVTSENSCYSAAYVEDVTIDDGTVMEPGEEFSKVWKIRNIGSCDWKPTFGIAFDMGDAMGGMRNTIKKTVVAGDAVSVSVHLTAPEEEGVYTGYWRMTTKDGEAFGYSVFVKIIVEEDDD